MLYEWISIVTRNELIRCIVDDFDSVCINFHLWGGGTVLFLICMVAFETPSLPTTPLCVCYMLMNVMFKSALLTPYCLRYMSGANFNLIKSSSVVFMYIAQMSLAGL